MKYYLGIDLGSTTTKAVLIDEHEDIVGCGLTNTRCDYHVATEVAKSEALNNARFFLLERELEKELGEEKFPKGAVEALGGGFRIEQMRIQFSDLEEACREAAPDSLKSAVAEIFAGILREAGELFEAVRVDRSRLFRDLAGSAYYTAAEKTAAVDGVSFDALVGVYDKAILRVESQAPDVDFGGLGRKALAALANGAPEGNDDGRSALRVREVREAFQGAVDRAGARVLEIAEMVGTGYGRQRLPFKKHQIRSEILCHGLGAHFMFPETRTVLDIGGQDTKAIQVDENGVVKNFQMNDRCAAGCGRYLGYIADELNLGLHELGPLSLEADHACRICSTCTVFAGAELRELLGLGEKRENILAGLHQAIVLRAMALLARSGGVENEFTFTGGVAKNPAAVAALTELVAENYGETTINIHADSIYTGAIGAALYARRAVDLEETHIA